MEKLALVMPMRWPMIPNAANLSGFRPILHAAVNLTDCLGPASMMQVDPHAWLLTLPLTIVLVQLRLRPIGHPIRKLLKELTRLESEAWSRVVDVDCDIAYTRRHRFGQLVHLFAVVCFAAASLASLGAFAGVLPAA